MIEIFPFFEINSEYESSTCRVIIRHVLGNVWGRNLTCCGDKKNFARGDRGGGASEMFAGIIMGDRGCGGKMWIILFSVS